MSKPFRKWKVTIKEVFSELPIHTELHGPFDLEDWYNIEEIKNE